MFDLDLVLVCIIIYIKIVVRWDHVKDILIGDP